MARIQTYTVDTTLNSEDMIIGTDGAQGANYATKNFTVGDLRTFILQGVSNDDVDTHLNVSSAESSQVLSWNGNDYTWVAQSGGGGDIGGSGTDTQMAIFDSASTITSTQAVAVNSSSQIIMDVLRSSASYVDDAAALAGGVPYGGLYRTDSIVKINLLGSSPGSGPGEVQIGSLIWTDANSTIVASSGGAIPILTTEQQAKDAYDNSTAGAIYYDFNAANSARGLFYNQFAANVITPPAGFRLPTAADWDNLNVELIAISGVQDDATPGGGGTNAFWNSNIKANTDYGLSGFDAIKAGRYNYNILANTLTFESEFNSWWNSEGTTGNPTGEYMRQETANSSTIKGILLTSGGSPYWAIRFCKDA